LINVAKGRDLGEEGTLVLSLLRFGLIVLICLSDFLRILLETKTMPSLHSQLEPKK